MRVTRATWSGLCAATLLAACGGGTGAGLPATPGDKPEAEAAKEEKPAEESPEAKASTRFEKLGKDLEDLGGDEPIDRGWLEGELKAILALDREHPGARFDLLMLNAKTGGDSGKLCAAYADIADDAPDFGPARENLAYCKVEAGKVDDAIDIYESLIADKEKKALTSRLAMARIYERRGEHKAAIELCRKVLQRKADAVEAFRILAHAYRGLGDASMAELVIARGLKMEKDDVELHYLAAKLLLDRGELSAGIDGLKHVLTLKPKWLKVRADLAQILISYDDWGNAAPHFETITQEAPENRAARLGLAVCYKGMGRYDEADKLFAQLLKENPNDADALWNRGMLYWHNFRKYDQAAGLLAKFREQAPSGDKDAGRVDRLLKRIDREQKDVEARRAREERERKRVEAIAAACDAVGRGMPPKAEAIGSDEDRIKAAWDLLLVTAVSKLQEGDVAGGKNAAECALEIVPRTPGPGVVACSQLRVNWVQLQDQAGLLMTAESLRAAQKTIGVALECDPENPDAQLFLEQLGGLIQQKESEAGGGGMEPVPGAAAPGGGL